LDLREGIEAELRYEAHRHKRSAGGSSAELASLISEAVSAGMSPDAIALLTGLEPVEVNLLADGGASPDGHAQ